VRKIAFINILAVGQQQLLILFPLVEESLIVDSRKFCIKFMRECPKVTLTKADTSDILS